MVVWRSISDKKQYASGIVASPTEPFGVFERQMHRLGIVAAATGTLRAKRRPKVADPPPKSVGIVPAPPEPPENVERRQRRSAGPDFVDPNSVDLIFEGATRQVTREITRKIKAVYPQAHSSYQWSKSGEHPWKLVVAGVDDIRVFAARLDLGKITRYDEQKGVIEIKLDPAKLPEPLPGLESGPPQGPFPGDPSFEPRLPPGFRPGMRPTPRGPRRINPSSPPRQSSNSR